MDKFSHKMAKSALVISTAFLITIDIVNAGSTNDLLLSILNY